MTIENVTPIRLRMAVGRRASRPRDPPADGLEALSGYSGSIQGTALDDALNEQRTALWGAQAVIDLAAAALEQHFGPDWPSDVPNYARALRNASKSIEEATAAWEPGVLEDRALAIARAKTAAGASS